MGGYHQGGGWIIDSDIFLAWAPESDTRKEAEALKNLRDLFKDYRFSFAFLGPGDHLDTGLFCPLFPPMTLRYGMSSREI